MNAPQRDAGFFTESLASRDPELFGSIRSELGRQRAMRLVGLGNHHRPGGFFVQPVNEPRTFFAADMRGGDTRSRKVVQ